MALNISTTITTRGLVSYLSPFNENQLDPLTFSILSDEIFDDTEVGFDGAINERNRFRFDSNNDSQVISSPTTNWLSTIGVSLGGSNVDVEYSIEAWVYMDILPSGTGTNGSAICGINDVSGGIGLQIYNNGGGNINVNFGDRGNGSVDGSQILSTGTWYHIVCTRSTASGTSANRPIEIYVNGQLDTSTTGDLRVNGSGQDFLYGFSNIAGKLNGRLGAVRVYNRALTSSEIINNYNVEQNKYDLKPYTFRQVLNLDGASASINLGSTFSTSTWSLSCWLWIGSISGGYLISDGNSSASDYVSLSSSTIVNIKGNLFDFSSAPYSSNEWNHFLISVNSQSCDLYINGTASASQGTNIGTFSIVQISGDENSNYLSESRIANIGFWNNYSATSLDAVRLYNNGIGLDPRRIRKTDFHLPCVKGPFSNIVYDTTSVDSNLSGVNLNNAWQPYQDDYDILLVNDLDDKPIWGTSPFRISYVDTPYRLRRDSDNEEADFSYDSNNVISGDSVSSNSSSGTTNGQTLTTWAGSSTLYVKRFYDAASNSGRIAEETNTSEQLEFGLTAGISSYPAIIGTTSGTRIYNFVDSGGTSNSISTPTSPRTVSIYVSLKTDYTNSSVHRIFATAENRMWWGLHDDLNKYLIVNVSTGSDLTTSNFILDDVEAATLITHTDSGSGTTVFYTNEVDETVNPTNITVYDDSIEFLYDVGHISPVSEMMIWGSVLTESDTRTLRDHYNLNFGKNITWNFV